MVAIGFIALLLGSEGHTDDLVFTHKELGIWLGLSKGFEVVGGDVIEGQHVDILELGHEGVHFFDDERLVLPRLGLHLGQRDNFVTFGNRHQQSIE